MVHGNRVDVAGVQNHGSSLGTLGFRTFEFRQGVRLPFLERLTSRAPACFWKGPFRDMYCAASGRALLVIPSA